MSAEQRELSGQLFCPGDPELVAIKRKAHKLNQDYNKLYEDETARSQRRITKVLSQRQRRANRDYKRRFFFCA